MQTGTNTTFFVILNSLNNKINLLDLRILSFPNPVDLLGIMSKNPIAHKPGRHTDINGSLIKRGGMVRAEESSPSAYVTIPPQNVSLTPLSHLSFPQQQSPQEWRLSAISLGNPGTSELLHPPLSFL